jgi:hypothetical protein
MATLRIIDVSANRDINVDLSVTVRGFRGATALLARDLRATASDEFRNRVLRLWAKHGRNGGFAVRNGLRSDAWVSFEYSERD